MFVINSIMDDEECGRIRRRLRDRGILVCDLAVPDEGNSGHRRWLTGTFALGAVVITLAQSQIPVLFTELAHPTEVGEDRLDPQLSRAEQLDRYGAEHVCPTDTFKGSLMLAIAANEMALAGPGWRDGEPDPMLIDGIIQRLGAQTNQWVSSS